MAEQKRLTLLLNAKERVGGAINKVMSRIKSLSAMAMKTGAAFTALGTAAGVGFGVKLAAEAEKAQIAFEVMLGSAGKARAMLADLTQFAARTPFQMEGISKAARTLLGFGVQAEDVMPTLKMLGNISAGTGKNMAELGVIFGQIRGAGRLMGQDLLQLINAGFNPLQIMAEKTGRSMGELKEAMSRGEISFEAVKAAFAAATGEGGRFNNLMQRQSKTLSGLFSTLLDNLKLVLRNLGQAFLPLLKSATNAALAFARTAADMAKAFRPGIESMLSGMKEFITENKALVATLPFEIGLQAVRMARQFSDNFIDPAVNLVFGWKDVLADAFAGAGSLAATMASNIKTVLGNVFGSILTTLMNGVRVMFGRTFDAVVGMVGTSAEQIQRIFEKTFNAISGGSLFKALTSLTAGNIVGALSILTTGQGRISIGGGASGKDKPQSVLAGTQDIRGFDPSKLPDVLGGTKKTPPISLKFDTDLGRDTGITTMLKTLEGTTGQLLRDARQRLSGVASDGTDGSAGPSSDALGNRLRDLLAGDGAETGRAIESAMRTARTSQATAARDPSLVMGRLITGARGGLSDMSPADRKQIEESKKTREAIGQQNKKLDEISEGIGQLVAAFRGQGIQIGGLIGGGG